jgi:type IV secretion system protein VirB2
MNTATSRHPAARIANAIRERITDAGQLARSTCARAFLLAAFALLHASAAYAGTGGGNMPWNAPLQNLFANITGPTARALVGVAVAIAGAIWMFKRHEEGAGRLGQVVAGGALLLGAQFVIPNLGFAGAVL